MNQLKPDQPDETGHKTPLAGAIRHAVTRLKRPRPYVDHRIPEPDDKTAERAGPQKLSLHGSLFMGSERGGKSAAVAYGPIETAKLDGGVPQDRLTHVPGRIADRTINRIDEPLPRHYPRASA